MTSNTREYQARYRQENKERLDAQKRAYIARNPEYRKEINRRYRERHREKIRQADRERRKTHEWKAYMAARCRFYQAQKRLAVPPWANRKKMDAIYAEAARMRAEGLDVHVDHVVPLNGRDVCGLHWEGNLEIRPAHYNRMKSNQWWPKYVEFSAVLTRYHGK